MHACRCNDRGGRGGGRPGSAGGRRSAAAATRAAQSRMASAASAAASRSVFHDDTLIRIAVAPPHWVGPHQVRPSAWTSAISASVVGPSTRRTSTWLSTTSFRMVSPPASSRSAIATAASQARVTSSATPSRPRVRSTAHTSTWPGPLRRLRRVVHRLELVAGREVAGHRGEGPPEVGQPADERDAAVVGDVEPLVAVGGPRVGSVEPAHEVGAARVGERPQPEGAVDVEPARRARPASRRSRRRGRRRRC